MKIGVIGAGQLGRMMALAGVPRGWEFRFLDPTPNSPASQVGEQIVAPYDDREALARLAEGCDVVTYEFENVPAVAAQFLAERVPLHPSARALEQAQDRLYEKTLFTELGIETPPFFAIETREDFDLALKEIGLPAVLKTRRLGYDGKGQAVLRTQREADEAFARLQGKPLILEGFVTFDRELSLIGVRDTLGRCAFYPLVENHHRDGILRLTLAPAPALQEGLQVLAETYLRRIMEATDYVGVLTVELFQKGDQLLANEMAPRVHNSGHWTIEGAETSQFENHLRAILGLPLGGTRPRDYVAMVNLIGVIPDPADILALPETYLHLYGKSARPGRKVGHITVLAHNEKLLKERVERIKALLPEV